MTACLPRERALYIGLMSGTSLDGVDAVLVDFAAQDECAGAPQTADPLRVLAHLCHPMPPPLQRELLALNTPGDNELHRAALAGNALARLYAQACHDLLDRTGVPAPAVQAIGAHGQTVRHRPGPHGPQEPTGYTLQLNNPALLAELTGVAVAADFRSRDVAAGGQGAPLVPAFHQRVFGRPDADVAILNLGGIANLTLLPATSGTGQTARAVLGFDCGPANALMDHWVRLHRQQPYDADGRWAASGRVHAGLLAALLGEPFFGQPPPKSTGRDLFHPGWLQQRLDRFAGLASQDVQATLLELTVHSVVQDLRRHQPACRHLLVCGGGALNDHLMRRLSGALAAHGLPAAVASTASQGLPPLQVEAAAFAWLARQLLGHQPGNLPSATGAAGPRVLGAVYPAH